MELVVIQVDGGEQKVIRNDNGKGGDSGYDCFGGGGYFSKGTSGNYGEHDYAMIGGQGGTRGIIERGRELEAAGDGGIAGKGGNISVSKNAKIYAYNGNMITNDDYVTVYYECNENGIEDTSKILSVLTKQNGNKIIPCPIFVQKGILRDIYKYNTYWGERKYKNYDYYYSLMGNTISITGDIQTASKTNPFDNILIRAKAVDNSLKTGYVNPITSSIYGIGSGAGYIEISNGSYTILD